MVSESKPVLRWEQAVCYIQITSWWFHLTPGFGVKNRKHVCNQAFFSKTLDKIQHYHRLGETTSLVFVIFGNLCLENSNPGVINSQRLHSQQGSYWHPVILIVDQNISEDATGCTGSPLHPKYYPVCSCCGVCHLSIPLLGQIDDGKHICKYGAA